MLRYICCRAVQHTYLPQADVDMEDINAMERALFDDQEARQLVLISHSNRQAGIVMLATKAWMLLTTCNADEHPPQMW